MASEADSMAFVMSLARTKRVKYIDAEGNEIYQEDNRWRFLDAEDLASGLKVFISRRG